jgi:uncharacterized protein DUF4398
MPLRRTAPLFVAVMFAAAALACGGDPPDKEMQQAQGAIDAARAAGAEQYAHDEFAAAQQALKHANDAVNDRDYRQALNDALDSREHAQNAAAMAADGKSAARVDADRAINAATGAVNELAQKLKTADPSRRAASPPRKGLADSERALQEARAAFGKADYLTARKKAAEASEAVAAANKALDTSAGAAKGRRR